MVAVDEFGVRKIYPTNTHRNCAKPWLLGKGDTKLYTEITLIHQA
jgi:hypothetical protein